MTGPALVGGPSIHSTYRCCPGSDSHALYPSSETPVRAGGCHRHVALPAWHQRHRPWPPDALCPPPAATALATGRARRQYRTPRGCCRHRRASFARGCGHPAERSVQTRCSTSVMCACGCRWTIRSDAARRAHIRATYRRQTATIPDRPGCLRGSRLSNLKSAVAATTASFCRPTGMCGQSGGRGASNIVIEDVYVHDAGRDAIKITPEERLRQPSAAPRSPAAGPVTRRARRCWTTRTPRHR